MIITSRNNPKIKEVIQLRDSAAHRRETGLYIVEGPRMVSEIPAENIAEVYVSESYLRKQGNNITFESNKLIETQDVVFEKLSDTKNPQGILAVVRSKKYSIDDLLSGGPILFLENIQDPGNLGTMFRTAEAAGAAGIICDKNTVDPHNSKVIRSTMGAALRMPCIVSENPLFDIDYLKKQGYSTYAAHLAGSVPYTEPSYTKSVFLIGNEAAGLSRELAEIADVKIRIPMEGHVESLNAAVAASILLYEWHRQNF